MVLDSIPRHKTLPEDPKEFWIWLEERKIQSEKECSVRVKKRYAIETIDEYNSFRIQAPSKDLFIEWIYEFDLLIHCP